MTLDARETPVPDTLYHGTDPANLDAIRREGLRPMDRQRVHLSGSVERAREVGRRHARDPVVLAVDAAGDDGRDHAASIPHDEVVGVEAVEELLTSRLALTTASGAVWRFTARELDELAAAAAYLDDRAPGADHVERALSAARDHREDLLDRLEWLDIHTEVSRADTD